VAAELRVLRCWGQLRQHKNQVNVCFADGCIVTMWVYGVYSMQTRLRQLRMWMAWCSDGIEGFGLEYREGVRIAVRFNTSRFDFKATIKKPTGLAVGIHLTTTRTIRRVSRLYLGMSAQDCALTALIPVLKRGHPNSNDTVVDQVVTIFSLNHRFRPLRI
jgi:prepilin-type processing-associated H-X9-DG protein